MPFMPFRYLASRDVGREGAEAEGGGEHQRARAVHHLPGVVAAIIVP